MSWIGKDVRVRSTSLLSKPINHGATRENSRFPIRASFSHAFARNHDSCLVKLVTYDVIDNFRTWNPDVLFVGLTFTIRIVR